MTTSAAARGEPDGVDFAFSRWITRWLAWAHADRPLTLVAILWGLTWLPLLALSTAEGRALGGAIQIPFLLDVSAHARAILGLPLLVLGASFAEARLREARRAFEEHGLVDDRSREPFLGILRSSAALVHSPWTEVALAALAVVSVAVLPLPVLARAHSWQAIGPGEDAPLTRAGWWLVVVVVPLYRYLLLRWTLRFVVWALTLARVSRLELRLQATHADRSGGLSFVGRSQLAFAPLALTLSILFAARLGNDVLHLGQDAHALTRPIALFATLALGCWIAPLFVFVPGLAVLKRRATLEHDAFAARCSRAFDAAWLRSEAPDVRAMLAGDEVQSLSSLTDVCDTVRRLRPVPLDRTDLVTFVLVALAPMLPLVLSTVPPAEVERLLRAVVL